MADSNVTQLLRRLSSGESGAADALFPLVYQELHSIGERFMQRERSDHTLQSTALVHEAYLQLVGADSATWENRAHFIAIAARAMRQILVDHAVTKKAKKRGGDHRRVALDQAWSFFEERSVDLIALDHALTRLARIDAQQSRLVELRFFGGTSMADAAKMLGLPERTAEREWRIARAWLRREVEGRAARADEQ